MNFGSCPVNWTFTFTGITSYVHFFVKMQGVFKVYSYCLYSGQSVSREFFTFQEQKNFLKSKKCQKTEFFFKKNFSRINMREFLTFKRIQ